MQKVAKSFDCNSFEFASTTEQMDALWSARKQALWASLAVRPEGTEVWSTDVAVPLSRMAELIGEWPKYPCESNNANKKQRYLKRERANLDYSTVSLDT